MLDASVGALVDDLFRRESSRLVSALVRILGPGNLPLVEDVVQDALQSAMQAWRFGPPDDPRAWILQVAKRRAIDHLRKARRTTSAPDELDVAVEAAFSPEADAENQLAMMFAIGDDALSPETHVTMILRLLCGFSSSEIARAFLVEVATIERRLHRGRARLRALGALCDIGSKEELRRRQPSVEYALYLLFNEGYHGSDAESPLLPALCADALRLAELLLQSSAVERSTVHALAALFCFNAARLPARLDEEGVFVPLAEQDRSRFDRALFERGICHLGSSAAGDRLTRFHLEAGIAFEHTRARSFGETDWARIVEYYDALSATSPGPIGGLNRAVALAELRGLEAGRAALESLGDEPKLAEYSFYWAALADIERRAGREVEARLLYERATRFAKSRAERASYERRLRELGS